MASADYRLFFARLEARERGEELGDEAAARLSLKGHTVRGKISPSWSRMLITTRSQAAGILAGMSASCVICPVEHIKGEWLVAL